LALTAVSFLFINSLKSGFIKKNKFNSGQSCLKLRPNSS